MDKLLARLLDTPWGRSFIGWTCIGSFVAMAAVGWAYLKLLDDYKRAMESKGVELQKCWEDRMADMKALHARQDTIQLMYSNSRKRR